MVRQLKHNKKGSALVLIIMVVAVLMILGTALLSVGLSDTKVAVKHQEIVQARNIALTGVNVAAERIINMQESDLAVINASSGFNTHVPFGEGSYFVTASHGSADTIILSSSGTVEGMTSTVELTLSVDDPSNLFDGLRQLAENGPLDLKQLLIQGADVNPINITINWDEDVYGEVADGVGVNLHKDNTDELSNGYIDLNADQTEAPPIELPDDVASYTPMPTGLTDLVFEEGINYTIDEIYFMNENIGSITFNTGNKGVQNVVVNRIYSKIPFTVNGTGTLNIYITGNAYFQTPSKTSGSSEATIFFYIMGDDPDVNYLTMDAGYFLNAYIYAPQTTVYISANNTEVHGAIVAEEIKRNDNQGPQGYFQYVPLSDDQTFPLPPQYNRSYYSN